MSGMDQELAAMYGTAGATQEDTTKVAEMELFCKLASENGIDLSQLNDDQITELYNGTFGKEASAEQASAQPQEPEQDKVAAAAEAEFNQQKEWREKVAECDKLGRIMAHAYVQELNNIKEASDKTAGDMPPQFMGGGKKDEEDKGDKEDKKDESKSEEDSDKEASAIDTLAAKKAVELAKEAGLDAELAAKRVDAVLTLGGPAASEKVASASNLQETVHIRALEFLETAGYPVNWESE